MEEPEDSIVEQRKKLMVPPTGGNPFLKKAFFLKPISTTDEPCSKIIAFCSVPSSHFEPNTTLRVKIRGWPQGQEDWKAWVDQMAPLHKSTWKKAGIYEAIFNSTYQIKRQTNLVCGFAAKWCSETNTFIFPWGEATITLEDAMVLGGYSVLGNSVSSPPESTELGAIEKKLIEGRKEIYRSGASEVAAGLWRKKFMNSGSEIEHEAFLVYWLSRYVFLGDRSGTYVIQSNAVSIAVHLARGTRIALAPAVLAGIYRDLGLLKKAIVNSNQLKLGTNTTIDQAINSSFHLVQIWAWERFSDLRPQNPKSIRYGEPRMARWDNVDCRKVMNLRMVLDSAGENFLWRPYALDVIGNCHLPKYYPQKEMWVLLGPDLDEELLSFARCLKISELVGFGTNNVEHYLPHRVAMQFGYDQDVPCPVTLPNSDSGLALEPENNEMNNVRLHIPSRLSEADVSPKYLKWWKQSVSGIGDGVATAVQQRKRTKIHERILLRANHTPVHSVHPPKHKRKEAEDPMDEDDDNLTISELTKKHVSFGLSQDHTNSDNLSSKLQKLGSPIAGDTSVDTMNIDQDIGSIVGNESSARSASFLERLLAIQARYKKIRSEVDELIAQSFGEKI